MSARGAMRWRMVLELAGADGTRQVHQVGAGERPPTGHTAATLGLGLEEGKAILAAVQRHLIAAQVDEHCRNRRRCDRCAAQRPLKGLRPRRLTSLFGVADRKQQQLHGVLQGLGATPGTPVTILSDGAEGPRSLGEAACIGPTRHVLDWFRAT